MKARSFLDPQFNPADNQAVVDIVNKEVLGR